MLESRVTDDVRGFALIPLLWASPAASFCPHRCMAAELSCVPVENAGGWTCVLGVGRPCLPPPRSAGVRWGVGRRVSGDGLSSEQPPGSLFCPPRFYAPGPSLLPPSAPRPFSPQLPSPHFPLSVQSFSPQAVGLFTVLPSTHTRDPWGVWPSVPFDGWASYPSLREHCPVF